MTIPGPSATASLWGKARRIAKMQRAHSDTTASKQVLKNDLRVGLDRGRLGGGRLRARLGGLHRDRAALLQGHDHRVEVVLEVLQEVAVAQADQLDLVPRGDGLD